MLTPALFSTLDGARSLPLFPHPTWTCTPEGSWWAHRQLQVGARGPVLEVSLEGILNDVRGRPAVRD